MEVFNKENIHDMYYLSPMQEGMLFYSRYNKGTKSFFQQVQYKLEGDVNINLIERTFNILIERHDILRTIFKYRNLKRPIQVVLKNRPSSIFYKDISHIEKVEKKNYLNEYKRIDKERGFDLSKDLLIRIAALKVEEDAHYILWSFHHIVLDGWCINIVFREFFEIYQALKNGSEANLNHVFPYRNYINWIEKQDKNKALDYWKDYFKGYKSKKHGQVFKNQKNTIDYRLQVHNFEIDRNLSRELKKLSIKYRVTQSTIFKTIWGILLQRYNDCDDIVFGLVVSGRKSEIVGIENMIGLFINTVPLRMKCDTSIPFSKLVQDVQKSSFNSEMFDYVPLSEIQNKIDLKNNLFDNILIFENLPLAYSDDQDKKQKRFKITDIEVFEQTNYNINVTIRPGEVISVRIAFNDLVYDLEFIRHIEGHLLDIINIVTSDNDIAIESIKMENDLLIPKEVLLQPNFNF